MIYVVVRLLIPIYVIGLSCMWISMVSDMVFQKNKRKTKDFLLRFLVSLIWPLSLVNANGRSIFINSFKKVFRRS